MSESLDAGAGALHKWTKEPVPWIPAPAASAEDTHVNAPMYELAAERSKWEKVWDAEDKAGELVRLGGQDLPRLTADQLRQASKEFSDSTASGMEGLHPLHFSMLCDDGLDCLGALLEAVEEGGVLPPQLRAVLVALIPKLTGGVKPIGIFPSL